MKYIFTVLAFSMLFGSANAMYQTYLPGEALGISSTENNNKINLGFLQNNNDAKIDESLIDQLIASFSNDNYNTLDESLIDQLIASFPDILDSYLSKTPFDIGYYEILIDTYSS